MHNFQQLSAVNASSPDRPSRVFAVERSNRFSAGRRNRTSDTEGVSRSEPAGEGHSRAEYVRSSFRRSRCARTEQEREGNRGSRDIALNYERVEECRERQRTRRANTIREID